MGHFFKRCCILHSLKGFGMVFTTSTNFVIAQSIPSHGTSELVTLHLGSPPDLCSKKGDFSSSEAWRPRLCGSQLSRRQQGGTSAPLKLWPSVGGAAGGLWESRAQRNEAVTQVTHRRRQRTNKWDQVKLKLLWMYAAISKPCPRRQKEQRHPE